jgi:hypothetical protein
MIVYGALPEGLAVADHDGSRWVGGDDVALLDATGQESGASRHAQECDLLSHDPRLPEKFGDPRGRPL